jgi:regulator of protease activity HflC (stomatin/prohibitin superfamily)
MGHRHGMAIQPIYGDGFQRQYAWRCPLHNTAVLYGSFHRSIHQIHLEEPMITNRIRLFLIATIAVLSLWSIGCTTVEPGFVGIEVNKLGSQKGVQDFPQRTGFVTYNPWATEIVSYPTFVQTAKWTKDPNEGHPMDESFTFTTKDSMVVNADVSASYHLLPERVPAFYVQFRLDDIDKFTHGFLRNITRDQFNEVGGSYNIEQVMGDNGPFLLQVRAAVQKQLQPFGVQIDQLGFIGAPRPPQNVIDSINMKVQAQQIALQKQIEVQQATADAQKNVAEAEGQAKAQIARANGEAEANRVRNSSLTPQLLELKRLENQHDLIWRWNGARPSTEINGAGGLMLQVPGGHQ